MIKMRVFILMILAITGLYAFGVEKTLTQYTDVDSVFTGLIMSPGQSQYHFSCDKPKGYDGLMRYRVSCIEYLKTHDPDIIQSHKKTIFTTFLHKGWHAGNVEETEDHIRVTMTRSQIEYEDCRREIYVVIPKGVNFSFPKSGDKIYLADPRAMQCFDAPI